MATKEEKQQLIDTLKFTPRTYKISMWGYGGEKVMGRVDPKVWDYCMENSVDLVEIAWSDEDTVQDDMGLDLDMLPFTPGQWYECDGMAHTNGVSRNAGTIQIEDENGNTVFEKQLEACDGAEGSPGWSCQDEAWVGSAKKGEVVFIGSSNEKGTFFEGEIELKAPFDIEKLVLYYDEVDGEELVNCVYYDDEEIENYGGSTDGKSSDMDMVRITDDDGTWERYEPEEKDWGHPEYGTSPSDWEKSAKFKFKDHRPVHPGYYSCNYGFGSTYGSLYWDGTAFGDWEHGKFHAKDDDGIVSWQGYNWDTSNWANQPPEPPDTACKKCKWVGSRDAMREDKDDYSYHCPECDSDDWDWVEYDPDTAKGRKNRAKYCKPAEFKPWDPAEELQKICDELDQFVDSQEQEAPWTPADTAPAEKGIYQCQLEKLPTWPWPNEAVLTWTGKTWKDENNKTVKPHAWRVLVEEDVT
jgi:hypothetical protein